MLGTAGSSGSTATVYGYVPGKSPPSPRPGSVSPCSPLHPPVALVAVQPAPAQLAPGCAQGSVLTLQGEPSSGDAIKPFSV